VSGLSVIDGSSQDAALPSTPLKQAILITQESKRQKKQLRSIPFYAIRAAKEGPKYLVHMCARLQNRGLLNEPLLSNYHIVTPQFN